ncbi:MAG: methylmalonyl-CoA mutase, partial [Anaerolineae bacterium]|nr:methylmalonyl-CoA mutase [Anaerolineae bacterium]
IIAYETGVADTVDPLAGSYLVEHLTRAIVGAAQDYITRIDTMGGAQTAIESGFISLEIMDAAYAYQRAVESGDQIVVGVNQFTVEDDPEPELLRVDPAIEAGQRARLAELRARRDDARVAELRSRLADAARGSDNLLPLFIECVEHDVTLGEICRTLRDVWGEYRPSISV